MELCKLGTISGFMVYGGVVRDSMYRDLRGLDQGGAWPFDRWYSEGAGWAGVVSDTLDARVGDVGCAEHERTITCLLSYHPARSRWCA